MTRELEAQVALVTGGSRGIGRAVSVKLAELGAHVFVNYNSSPAAAEETVELCRKAGGKAEAIKFNVAESEASTKAIDSIVERAGKLDILVNNAGIAKDGLFVRMKDEDWSSVLAVNLNGAFYCSRAATKHMMKARVGSIVNISSVTAEMGNMGQAAYISSKAGLIGLTKALSKELGIRSITVNAITPGFIDTEMTGDIDAARKEEYLKTVPLRRFGEPEEVAALVAFLAGPSSRYITGQVIGINGGIYLS